MFEKNTVINNAMIIKKAYKQEVWGWQAAHEEKLTMEMVKESLLSKEARHKEKCKSFAKALVSKRHKRCGRSMSRHPMVMATDKYLQVHILCIIYTAISMRFHMFQHQTSI